MNDYFQENRRTLFILIGLLFLLAIVLYFILLRPLNNDLTRQDSSITSIKSDIKLLEAQLDGVDDDYEEIAIDELKYEKIVPRKLNIDDYILSLQQLEFVTKTKILSIDFTYDGSLDILETESESEDDEATADRGGPTVEHLDEVDIDLEGTADDEDQVEVDQQLLNEKPETLQVIIASVSAVSSDYDNFLDVLRAIENNERISVISNLAFTKPTEEDMYFSDIPLDWIPFEIELTTFYYDD